MSYPARVMVPFEGRLALIRARRNWARLALALMVLVLLSFEAYAQNDPKGVGAKEPQATEKADADAGMNDSGEKAEQKDGVQNEPASEAAGESPEDAEKALKEAAEQVKEKADEAVGALKEGDLTTAAKKSGELFATFAIPAITVIVMLILAYFVAAYLARLCSAPLRKRVDETLGRFVGKLVFYLVMVSAVLGVLQYFGIGITSFAAIIAAAGFAVGLAFQGTLSNFSAGIMLLVFRPFKVGDVITAAGLTAKVHEIDLFTTIFDTPDNRRIIVPNSAIASGTIENITHHHDRRVDVGVGVDYSANIQQTRDTLTAAAESLRESLLEGDGRGYQVALGDLGDSAVNWTVRFWTTADKYWPVKEQLTAAVKEHLEQAGIGIPFPQMDVHVHQG